MHHTHDWNLCCCANGGTTLETTSITLATSPLTFFHRCCNPASNCPRNSKSINASITSKPMHSQCSTMIWIWWNRGSWVPMWLRPAPYRKIQHLHWLCNFLLDLVRCWRWWLHPHWLRCRGYSHCTKGCQIGTWSRPAYISWRSDRTVSWTLWEGNYQRNSRPQRTTNMDCRSLIWSWQRCESHSCNLGPQNKGTAQRRIQQVKSTTLCLRWSPRWIQRNICSSHEMVLHPHCDHLRHQTLYEDKANRLRKCLRSGTTTLDSTDICSMPKGFATWTPSVLKLQRVYMALFGLPTTRSKCSNRLSWAWASSTSPQDLLYSYTLTTAYALPLIMKAWTHWSVNFEENTNWMNRI